MRPDNNTGCYISDDWTYKGMRVIWLENAFLRIGILADRGSDIFEFRYKPLDLNLLLHLPGRLHNISEQFSQMRDTQNQFEDHYYGGWQEILPNSKPFTYRGASLGQHGEVSMIPWRYDILEASPERVSVRLSATPLRVPLTVEKVISMEKDASHLDIEESVTNTSNTRVDFMWGHHIALGLPFAQDALEIVTNAASIRSEPLMPTNRRFKPSVVTEWPWALSPGGEQVRADIFPARGDGNYSELSYLTGYPAEGKYAVQNRKSGIAFNVHWDAEVFPCLWMWQERNVIMDFPWWGDCYTLALEPWSAPWTDNPESAIANGEWLHLEPRTSLSTKLSAGITEIT